jgi:hypothetical protein
MPVANSEFERLRRDNLSARAVSRNSRGEITGVEVKVRGNNGGRRACWFTVFLDVESIRGAAIPPAYVVDPPFGAIGRPNIYAPSHCEKLGRELPMVCWGHGDSRNYDGKWASLAPNDRSLTTLHNMVRDLLAT